MLGHKIKFQFVLRVLLLLGVSILFSSCRSCRFNYCVQGADEFVIDSYKIRQGKLAIMEMKGEEVGELPFGSMSEYCDVIAEDDILNIVIYHPTRRDLVESMRLLNSTVGFRVVNGQVDLIDIPPVHIEGLTLDEARDKLQQEFREQVQDVEVFLAYKDRLARKVELTGMVGLSDLPVDGRMRLYEVLGKARVPNGANFYDSYVVRDGAKLPIDLHRLMNEGDMSYNIVMRGGDKVFIAHPNDARAMVMGEVLRPIAVSLPYGFMSLREALVMAGGIPFTGNRNCIMVIRGGVKDPRVYVVSWEHILHLPNESLLLIPGDTVYVSEKPITQWNRFISQLLPSFGGFQSGMSAYRLMMP